jgi:hypothetical protein
MASPSNASVSSPQETINYTFDIYIMKSILHTIHSSDLIHRQPTEAQRTAFASTVSLLSRQLTKTEEELQKRDWCGKRLQRFLTCRDKDFVNFVKLKDEVREVYSELLLNAT